MKKCALVLSLVAAVLGITACGSDASSTSADVKICERGKGSIINDITQRQENDGNETHANGHCLAHEQCVKVFNDKPETEYACSLYEEGKLECAGSIISVVSDPNNCGKCGNQCGSSANCINGHCVPKCGNGVLDEGEQCDGNMSITMDCGPEKYFEYASSGCRADCTMDQKVVCHDRGAVCGNGKLENGEECDGVKVDLDYECPGNKRLYYSDADKETRCTSDCKINADVVCRTDMCGNGVLDDGEECDGDLISENYACGDGELLNYENADKALRCQGCTVIKDAVCKRTCGNGKLDEGEACEGNYYDKSYSCGAGKVFNYTTADDTQRCINCKINDSVVCKDIPSDCGNNVIDGSEECDGTVVSENVCGEGFRLKSTYSKEMCTELCTLKSGNCISSKAECLNGYLDDGEECEKGGIVSKTACGEGMAPNVTQLEDMSLCSMSCLLTDKDAICHEENVCGDGYVDEGEWCDYTLAEDGVTRNYIYSPELNPNCKIPEIKWPWFADSDENQNLAEKYFARPECKKYRKTDCYLDNPVMGEYCPLKDDYLYIQSGVNECHVSAERTGNEIIATLTFTAEEKYQNTDFYAVMYCDNDDISVTDLVRVIDIENNNNQNMSVVHSGQKNTITVDVSKLSEEGAFYCYVILKGQPVMYDEGSWDWDEELDQAIPTSRSFTYMCKPSGEPVYAINTMLNLIMGDLGFVSNYFSYVSRGEE